MHFGHLVQGGSEFRITKDEALAKEVAEGNLAQAPRPVFQRAAALACSTETA
jgi:hypothetical protein